MPPAHPSRRAVLRGTIGLAAFVLVSGCTSDDDGGSGAPGGKDAPNPDIALVTKAVADKEDLLAAYEATLTQFAQLSDRLKPLREDHAAHLAALTTELDKLGGRAEQPGPSASASPTGPSVPGSRDQAVEALATAELAAAGRRVGQCRDAKSPELARLLASIGGCEAAHTAVLRRPAS